MNRFCNKSNLCFLSSVYLVVAFFLLKNGSLIAQCMPPYSQFTYNIQPDGFTVVFNAESCDPDQIFNWSFGDGAIDEGTTPTHIYSEEGTYVVTMTVSYPSPCTLTYTQTETIVINSVSPSSLWLELSGPTLLGECQQAIFNANVIGGQPPYRFKWDLGSAYCPSDCPTGCSPPSQPIDGGPTFTASFQGTGGSGNNVCVEVFDAIGNSDYKCLEIKVKDFIYPLEINLNGTNSGGCYIPNSNIVFLPDIDPLTAFEYPIIYEWDFGDGNTFIDNFDGGGVAIHQYATPSNGNTPYIVKLKVSDLNGSMQATKDIVVCGDGNSSGGEWTLSNGTGWG